MKTLKITAIIVVLTATTVIRSLAVCGTGYMPCSSGGGTSGQPVHSWCCPTSSGGFCGGWIEAKAGTGAYGDCKSNQ